MSVVYPVIDGFAGFGGLGEALLRSDEPWDAEHPMVLERPELFQAAAAEPEEPVRRGPGRPPGAKNRPKDV